MRRAVPDEPAARLTAGHNLVTGARLVTDAETPPPGHDDPPRSPRVPASEDIVISQPAVWVVETVRPSCPVAPQDQP